MSGNYVWAALVQALSRPKKICAVSPVWVASRLYVEKTTKNEREKMNLGKTKISENAKRIAKIEAREEKNARMLDKVITDLAFQIRCGVKTGHCFTIRHVYQYACVFRCIKCGLEYTKSKENLNERERGLLKALLGDRK